MAGAGHSLWGRGNADQMQAIYQLEEGPTQGSNATQALIDSLVFSQSKTVRTSTMILGAFNILAAFLTASSILYDCYWASKRTTRGYKAKKFCVSAIHPAETFPLVLAVGVFVQGSIFLGAQATGLSNLFTEGCSVIARFVFPAIFLVPYIQIVFGIECAIRSLRKGGFPARGKYDVTICLTVIALMLFVTSIPTHVRPETNYCFASLAWFVTRYGQLGLVLLASCTGLAIISATIIFYRLTTLTAIDQHQRIAASRMVYYLVLAVVALVFITPWFVTLTMKDPTLVTSMMATVILNLHGLMAGFLQMFLRSNTAKTSFKPKGMRGWGHECHRIRFWGPNELGFDGHMLQPVSGPPSPASIGSRASLIEDEKRRPLSTDSIRSPVQGDNPDTVGKPAGKAANKSPNLATLIKPEAATLERKPTKCHQRKPSYSLFPLDSNTIDKNVKQELQTSFIWKVPESRIKHTMAGIFRPSPFQRQTAEPALGANDFLAPPPPLFAGNSSRHRRDSSIQTSVTVEIGLRLSHAPPELQLPSPPRSRRASPLLRLQTNLSPIFSRSPLALSPLRSDTMRSPLSAEQRAARMKTLPPIPRLSTTSDISAAPESMSRLSPTVYTPQGVKRSATTAMSPPPRPNSSSPIWPRKIQDESRPRGSKASWI